MAEEVTDGGTTKPKPKVPVAKLKAAILPDTLVTPKGNILTREQFLQSAKNGLPFNDMKTMGDWLDGWAKPVSSPQQLPPIPGLNQVQPDYYNNYSTPGSGAMRLHQ